MRKTLALGFATIIFGGYAGVLAELYPANERFGVAYDYSRVNEPITHFDLQPFQNIGWYVDNQGDYPDCAGPISLSNGRIINRPITVGVSSNPPEPNTINSIMSAHWDWFESSTTYWQIGNRLGYDCYTIQQYTGNRQFYLIQSYVQNFHDLSQQIKAANENFRIASGIISPENYVNSSYGNSDFLTEAIWQYYNNYHQPMDIDVFNLEITIAERTVNPLDSVKRAITDFRNLLASGLPVSYQQSELWVRIGIAGDQFSEYDIKNFMEQTVDWLCGYSQANICDTEIGMPDDDYRLVQRWAWQPVADPSYEYRRSSLFSYTGELTPVGVKYSQLIPTHCPEPATLTLITFWLFIILPVQRNRVR